LKLAAGVWPPPGVIWQLTKHARYAYLRVLFNFIRNNLDGQLDNPCDTPMLKKLFRPGMVAQLQIPEKETIDEIIFRTTKPRNRLILELMAQATRPEAACGHLSPKVRGARGDRQQGHPEACQSLNYSKVSG